MKLSKKIKTFSTKLLSGLLSVAMIMSSVPTNLVYAEDFSNPDAQIVTDDSELGKLVSEIVIDGNNSDPNVNSIPEDENGDDQVVLDVDTPPNITIIDPNGTTDSVVSSDDSTNIDDSDNQNAQADNQNVSPDDTNIDQNSDDSSQNDESSDQNLLENDENSNDSTTVDDENSEENQDNSSDSGENTDDSTLENDENSSESEENQDISDNKDDENLSESGENTNNSDNENGENSSDPEDSTLENDENSSESGENTDNSNNENSSSDEYNDSTDTPGDEEITPTGEPGEDENVPSGIPSDSGEDISTENPESTDEPIEPIYTYSININETSINITQNHEYNISSEVVATKTTGEEVENLEYSIEYLVTDENDQPINDNFVDNTSLNTSITFTQTGNYKIIANLYDIEGTLQDTSLATVIVEKELPVITFDQIYTSFDTSLVQTLNLIIKTSDPSVFTKNTNVVSNFDDVYVISCSSLDEARSVYSYYIDKVDAISDMSNVISIATDENSEDAADLTNLNENTEDAIAQLNDIVPEVTYTDYSDYIALIDTGANADVNFSVVGTDTSDSQGHGTQMLEFIKDENPNAKVMSIKVFDGTSTSAANVYAGIKLAIESKVKIINLSLVGANTTKNEIVAQAIEEALDAGIVVIGAAGNYNLDVKYFIPGVIGRVISVGAIRTDYYKHSNSNYNASVYVMANSSSEAAARYSGMYSANNVDFETNLRIKPQTIEETIHDDKKLYK